LDSAPEWTVVLGTENRNNVAAKKISLPIVDIITHPNFVEYQNDIGNFNNNDVQIA
jgi:hypothetical protein